MQQVGFAGPLNFELNPAEGQGMGLGEAREHIERFFGEFGASPVARWVVALIGGVLMGIGARWAGGCTSGHGISGTLQLAVSSWLAAIGIFAVAYSGLRRGILGKGDFGDLTLPGLLKVNAWVVVVPVVLAIIALLWWIESAGFGTQAAG